MISKATRMRDKGRSWTEIADELDVSVAEAKSLVLADKQKRRDALSKTQIAEDRNGLRNKCICKHERKVHADKAGACSVCVEEPCDEFEEPFTGPYPSYRDGVTPMYDRLGRRTHYHVVKVRVDPNRAVPSRLAWAAWYFGVAEHPKNEPEIPHPSLKIKVRRARKRLKSGKPVYKRTDRKI